MLALSDAQDQCKIKGYDDVPGTTAIDTIKIF